MKLTHASVFSGIGGPEVAAAMLGWDNLFHCEINPFGRAVLEYWFPNATSYEDITKTDFSEWRGKVNVLTGGFPCQPFSYAGQRRGEKDDRYLWPYMHQCINQVRPDWVVCENVGGITTMVEQGSVTDMAVEKSLFDEGDTLYRYRLDETFTLERICEDLEGDGYAVQAVIIPACAVNAPHRRDRVFIIGSRIYPDIQREPIRRGGESDTKHDCRRFAEHTSSGWNESKNNPSWSKKNERSGIRDVGESSADPSDTGLQETRSKQQAAGDRGFGLRNGSIVADTTGNGGYRIPTGESGQAARQDGQLDAEPAINGGVLPRIIADTDCNRGGEMDEHLQPRLADGSKPVGNGRERIVTDAVGGRISGCSDNGEQCDEGHHGQHQSSGQPFGIRHQQGWVFDGWCDSDCAGLQRWADFPTVSPVHRGNDGLPFPLDDLAISPSKWRTESLKAYGNAIVPQVMYEIFRAIEETYDTRH